MPEIQRPTSAKVKKIVADGIRSFSRQYPGVVITGRAKFLLLAHAAKHEEAMLLSLKSHKQTPRKFVNGLQEILAYAASREQHKLKADYYHALLRAAPGEKDELRSLASHTHIVIKDVDLKVAMKRKCKTFPWC
jgi:hypothetical protein